MKKLTIQPIPVEQQVRVPTSIIDDRRLNSDETMLLLYLYCSTNIGKEFSDSHLREFLGKYDYELDIVKPMSVKKFRKIKARLKELGYLEP